jgi:hypothetical protein
VLQVGRDDDWSLPGLGLPRHPVPAPPAARQAPSRQEGFLLPPARHDDYLGRPDGFLLPPARPDGLLGPDPLAAAWGGAGAAAPAAGRSPPSPGGWAGASGAGEGAEVGVGWGGAAGRVSDVGVTLAQFLEILQHRR